MIRGVLTNANANRVSAAPMKHPARERRSQWREGKYLSPFALLLYFVLWFAATENGFAWVSDLKLPSPWQVLQSAYSLRDQLLQDVWATSVRVISGLTVGVLAGIMLGLWMSFSKKVFYFFNPLIESMRPVPAIAMIPFFLLWFGLAESGKFFLVVLGVFAIMVVSTLEAARNVPKIYARAAQTLGAGKRQVFRTIVFPAIVPGLVGPLRVCAALSFTLVVAAEFMGAQSGLGFRILEARRLFNPAQILVGVTLLGILSGLLDTALRRLTSYLTRWTERNS